MTRARDIANSTNTLDVDGGTIKLDGNYPTGTFNVALGDIALDSLTASPTSINNTAIGYAALTNTASGGGNTGVGSLALNSTTSTSANNTALGYEAGKNISVANNNVAIGAQTMYTNSVTGSDNVAVGKQSLFKLSSGQYNTAVGSQSLWSNTTASNNTAVGYQAGYSNTTGTYNTALGTYSLFTNDTGVQNVAIGHQANYYNTTGSYNVAVGRDALQKNTTASNNTAVGYQAGYNNTTGLQNVFVGRAAAKNSTTGTYLTAVGDAALELNTTGILNTAVGLASGRLITTGSKNSILGAYTGNQGGLDIRTSSNNIVLSDGDGNPRVVVNGSGQVFIGATSNASTESLLVKSRSNGNRAITASGLYAVGGSVNIQEWQRSDGTVRAAVQYDDPIGGFIFYSPTGHGITYSTSSDYRLKENVVDLTGATDRIQQLAPKRFNFIADADKTVDGFLAHEVSDIVPEAIIGTKDAVDADGNPKYQGIDQAKLVPLLTAALQEALTKIDDLEARIAALESN